MHKGIINEKGGHGKEFGREQGEAYDRVWREEWERRNDVIILRYQKQGRRRRENVILMLFGVPWCILLLP